VEKHIRIYFSYYEYKYESILYAYDKLHSLDHNTRAVSANKLILSLTYKLENQLAGEMLLNEDHKVDVICRTDKAIKGCITETVLSV